MIDLARFAELGKEGVLALLADSTNAERPGFTPTERTVNNSLDSLFLRAEGKRIIVATFASSISRVQMIINCAVKYGRKVALSGRSMVNVMGIASELGYLNIPDGVLIDLNLINRYEPGQLVLITTGSQGEPMSAPDPHGLFRPPAGGHQSQRLYHHLRPAHSHGNEKTVGAVGRRAFKAGLHRDLREHVRGSRLRPRLSGGAEDDAGPDQAPVFLSLSTVSRSTCASTRAWPWTWACPGRTFSLGTSATCWSFRRNG